VGTATLNLQTLLRQGRDFAELLVEVPIMDHSAALPDALLGQSVLGTMQGGANDSAMPMLLSKGSVVVRIINIGREPANMGCVTFAQMEVPVSAQCEYEVCLSSRNWNQNWHITWHDITSSPAPQLCLTCALAASQPGYMRAC
jgi:hypothetical protein